MGSSLFEQASELCETRWYNARWVLLTAAGAAFASARPPVPAPVPRDIPSLRTFTPAYLDATY